MAQISGKSSTPFWGMRSGGVTKIYHSLPSLLKEKGLRDIEDSINIRNLLLSVNSVPVSSLIYYDTLIQNAIDIITKCDRTLLQNVSSFYYKMRQVYHKMRQLLQIAMILLQNETVITKYIVYYKLRQYRVFY